MKKLNALLVSLLLVASTSVFAVAIKSDQEIAGSWLLEYTKKSPDDKDSKEMGITWVLKDQKLIIKDIPQARGNPYDSAPVDYLIENGNLKVGVPGRAGKFDEYELVEKTDASMVLKDPKFGTYFYFKKK
ncbi:hypothetical protein BAC3_00812 [uncultured bacterium]|nr:hypothetical protein BAC3_00812 [uncultured bacterium]